MKEVHLGRVTRREKRDTNTFNDWSIYKHNNGWDQLRFHLRITTRIWYATFLFLQCQQILCDEYIKSTSQFVLFSNKVMIIDIPVFQLVCIVSFFYSCKWQRWSIITMVRFFSAYVCMLCVNDATFNTWTITFSSTTKRISFDI
jgi:hypothetical protein